MPSATQRIRNKMINYLSEKDIISLIEETCVLGGIPELGESIFISFEGRNEDIVSEFTFNPLSIIVNKRIWGSLSDDERLYAIKKECCHLMASFKMNFKVKPLGLEWRFFAMKIGILVAEKIEAKSRTFVLLSKW